MPVGSCAPLKLCSHAVEKSASVPPFTSCVLKLASLPVMQSFTLFLSLHTHTHFRPSVHFAGVLFNIPNMLSCSTSPTFYLCKIVLVNYSAKDEVDVDHLKMKNELLQAYKDEYKLCKEETKRKMKIELLNLQKGSPFSPRLFLFVLFISFCWLCTSKHPDHNLV
jgi:hypothetical protein